MVNFKCCPNIFVIFLGKKMEIYIYIYILWFLIFFFFGKKKLHFATWQMPQSTVGHVDHNPCS